MGLREMAAAATGALALFVTTRALRFGASLGGGR